MGLDMFAHSMRADTGRPAVDFDVKGLDLECNPRIHYWRKHPNLHGWMAALYYSKGGSDDNFNVSAVELLPVDIDALECTILENRLPETSGYFFGQTTGEERADDLEFIRKCREEFSRGRVIAYYAWW